MSDTPRPDARTLTPDEYRQHLLSLGLGEEAHRVQLYGTRPPRSAAPAPAPARTSAPRKVVDARSMTPEQWQQHCVRLNAGDISRERFVGEDARDLVEGSDASDEPDATAMPREQFREQVARHAPDVAHEMFGQQLARPLPTNAEVDAALVTELERLRSMAGARADQYHVDTADDVVRTVARRLGVNADALGQTSVRQAAVRLQTRSRLVLDRSGAGGVERWGLSPQARRAAAVGGDAL